MFQFPGFAHHLHDVHGLQPCRLPDSDIAGSFPVCRSPALFAAYHVLLRLQKPRHPPFALLTFLFVNQPLSPPGPRGKLFALEIVVFATRKNSNFAFRLIFFFTSLSLSIIQRTSCRSGTSFCFLKRYASLFAKRTAKIDNIFYSANFSRKYSGNSKKTPTTTSYIYL